jgi:long-chain acyl-CoA synthetase
MTAVQRVWARTLRRKGHERAVVEAATGNACTFEELETRAQAWLLRHRDSGRALAGRAVVFAMPNGIAWLEVFLGLMHAGAVAVPLDGAEPAEAQRRSADALRAAYWWNGDSLEPLANARRFADPETFLIKLTSGTTGRPRPLVFSGAQMLADARQVTGTMRIRETDTNYALIPFGHSYGLGNLTLPLIAHGVPLVCGTAPLPQAIADDVERWRPTVFPTVPAVLRALAAADVRAEALASLKTVISAGAPLPPEVARAFLDRFGRRVHSFYGSSETGGIAYDRTGNAALIGAIGTPMRGVTVDVLPGRKLRVCSAAVFTAGNRSRQGKVGAWTPPDLAERDARGQIILLGRRGSTVKIGGRRVNLMEVTARLRRVPGVRDVWVAASDGADTVLGAAIVSTRNVAEIRGELGKDTAPWKVPKKWALLPELPLTARGKLDTRALQATVFGSH